MGKGDDDDLDMDALNKELGDSAGDESYEIEDDADLSGSVDMSANPAGAGAKFPSTGQPGSKPTSVTLDESGGDLFSEPSESGAGLTGRTDSKPVAASKPPSVRAPASKPPSRPASVAPEKSGAELSGGLSGSVSANDLGPSASKTPSKPPSRPGTASGARPGSAAGTTPASAAAPVSRRSTPPASVAPSVSGTGVGAGGTGGSGGGDGNSNSYNSDEFGDILGPSHSRGELSPTTPSAAKPAAKPAASLASLPRASGGGATPPPGSTRGPGSQPVSGHATPVGAPGSVSGAVPPSPHHVTFSPDTSLRPPQPTDSPGASRVGRLGPGPGLQHSGSRRTQTRCDIPTPFELFRLYDKVRQWGRGGTLGGAAGSCPPAQHRWWTGDTGSAVCGLTAPLDLPRPPRPRTSLAASPTLHAFRGVLPLPLPLPPQDNNGSVALAEFSRMLRDLEGRPHHFPQEEDPEWRLEKAQARK